MAFPSHQLSRLSSEVQLPIVLVPDIDDHNVDSGMEPEVNTRPVQAEPQPPSVPQHPIPSMQQAFAESLIEATQGHTPGKPKLRTGDAKARREELLDGERLDPPPTALWRRRPGQTTHELFRLMAQISFGVYLLLNGMANSQILVVSILQGHIDEVDEFLETTLEDMDLAMRDMEERIKHLKLPMDNISVFERMLEDRKFRMQIIDGNQKIQHILARTQVALQQAMKDLHEGLSATREFTIYLAEQQHGNWRRERPDVIDIFDAMKGNTDGWHNAFLELQVKGHSLDTLIVRLTDIVSEMERRADEVSRKTRDSVAPSAGPSPVPSGQPSAGPYEKWNGPSPKHTPRSSDASSIATLPSSPPRKVPNSPPRLSLRLSTIDTVKLSISPELEAAPGQERVDEEHKGEDRPRSTLMVTSRSPPPASPPESPIEESQGEQLPDKELPTEKPPVEAPVEEPVKEPSVQEAPAEEPPMSPPSRNPRRLSERPATLLDAPKLEIPKEDDLKHEESTLYILQPRTYTPQLSSPQLSPRMFDPRSELETETHRPRIGSPTSSIASAAQLTLEPARPRVEQVLSKPQQFRPKVVEINREPKPVSRLSQRLESRPASRPGPAQAPEPVIPSDPEVHIPRTSLRQRVSLKRDPPESIQVPPPGAELQPRSRAVQQSYQAPDSAYASDMERPPVHSMASINSSLADFPMPYIQPGTIPSPHSERQFFRPVQASPYSPLQQRPHTSGTIGPHHFPAPPRNIPSAMGMSVMSNGTTMTGQMGGGKSVKKKRSAFGWLKKAFSLDEEERAAFEQRRKEQMANPYYEAKSQQFLDGKRIRPRPGY
ncbi:hypothetical protein VTI74DRAFT_6687 [Chaetomium olivicolor]